MRLARLLSWIAPRLRMVTLQAGRMSGDPAVVEAYCADPLIYRGKVPVRTLVEVLGTVRRLPARLPEITVPVLLLHGTADELAAPSGSQLVYDTVGSAAKERIFYEGLPHELFHDPACARVLSDMTCWLEGRLPAASPQRSEPR
jgi:acylglycerol lipase